LKRELKTETKMVKHIDDKQNDIYNVMNFPTKKLIIDFNNPKMAQNEIIKITEEIENNSWIANSINMPKNIGEGIVWTSYYNDSLIQFKSKGKKHANSKVKTLKPVDTVKEQAKIDFANYATPAWRLEQMYQETFDTLNGGKGDVKCTGDFLRAVINDIMKEEMDIMKEKNLEPKEVNSMISKISRDWFMDKLNEEVGL